MGQKNRKHWPKQVRTMSKISVWVSVSRTYTSSTETEPHNIKYYYVQVVLRKFLVLYWQATRVLSSKLKKKREKAKGNRFFFFFLFWYVLWMYTWFWFWFLCVCVCLLGVWVLRKCGKAKGNSFFFLWSVWFLRNWKQPKADGTKSIEIQSVWK